MTKLLTIALTISALALGSTFAGDCGGCSGKKKDEKKEGTKENAARVIQL